MGPTNAGKEKLNWSDDIWGHINSAVHDETVRTKVAAKFLPLYPVAATALTVPSDAVQVQTNSILLVDEFDQTPIIEIYAEFALTKPQYDNEENLMTAVTLAIKAANLLSRAEDVLIFQGDAGIQEPLFQSGAVKIRGAKLVNGKFEKPFKIVGLLPAESDQQITVKPTEPSPDPKQNRYAENTFGGVAEGYSILQKTHYGRQVLILPTTPYADSFAPIRTTLIMPADRIKGLVDDRFYGTSSLPDTFDDSGQPPTPQGILVAIDGNTMDRVVGVDNVTAFTQVDGDQLYRFQVLERFALRKKDSKAVVSLSFAKA
jgi:uncharacterized linocin/CFP29 family protein